VFLGEGSAVLARRADDGILGEGSAVLARRADDGIP